MRRATLLLGALLTMVVVAGGVAWAANVIQCPNAPADDSDPNACYDTEKNDIIYGTSGTDNITWGRTAEGEPTRGRGVDVVYARGGDDYVFGGKGPDVYYGGTGDDALVADCDLDYYCGKDEKHGGPGDDRVVGNLSSEKHFGGRGNDTLVDSDSSKYPDKFYCGPGRDTVYYSKGVDKVADDCEVLHDEYPYY
jgi:Ca2+-binding RTX toxin-like protein